MISGLIALVVLYITILVVMVVFQRQLMYVPDKQLGAPEQYGLSGFQEITLKTSDNFSLRLWYKPAAAHMPTIAYFHGNASNIGNRAGIYSALSGKGFGVLALSYRGYGASEGMPSEKGIYIDARLALSYLVEQQHIPLSQIMLYGESLGTGVAVQIASESKVAAVILQAPYTSVSTRAAEIYFFLPVKYLLFDHFESLAKISNVKSPLLIFHGELDAIIPIRHGKALLAAANEPKEGVFFVDVEHNNFDSGLIAKHVLEFAKKQQIILP